MEVWNALLEQGLKVESYSGLISFDAKLTVETLGLLVEELSQLELIREMQVAGFENLPDIEDFTSILLPSLKTRANRLKTCLAGGRIEHLACREKTQQYLRSLWAELGSLFREIDNRVPSAELPEFGQRSQLERLDGISNLIREAEQIRFASPEEEAARLGDAAWKIARNHDCQTASEYLAVVLRECGILGIRVREYERRVVETGVFPLTTSLLDSAPETEERLTAHDIEEWRSKWPRLVDPDRKISGCFLYASKNYDVRGHKLRSPISNLDELREWITDYRERGIIAHRSLPRMGFHSVPFDTGFFTAIIEDAIEWLAFFGGERLAWAPVSGVDDASSRMSALLAAIDRISSSLQSFPVAPAVATSPRAQNEPAASDGPATKTNSVGRRTISAGLNKPSPRRSKYDAVLKFAESQATVGWTDKEIVAAWKLEHPGFVLDEQSLRQARLRHRRKRDIS